MSAHDQIRAMLDQLMGTGRNGRLPCFKDILRVKVLLWADHDLYEIDNTVESGENNRFQVKFTDAKVCKSFLLSCCPHEILSSTRMDLGECPKIHDLALRADYEQASHNKDYYYDIDAMEHLQAFIADCDRRTEMAKQRLAETQEELSAEVAAKANKVHELAEQIGKKLAKAEQLGAEGFVEESMKLMEEVEDLRKKKAAAEQEYRNSMPASSYQQQKLRVCEVCSAYLGIHDNDRRLADHFGGKLHLGFIKIREKLSDLQQTVEERKQKKKEEKDRDREREERERERLRERDRERERGSMSSGRGSADRHRSGRRSSPSRQHRRSRSRSKSHSSRSQRSRSRSRGRRSREYRSLSRDRKRSRSREGRDRAGDRRER
ncbi:putative RNA-binding protein Luc7-like 1 isoform X1 [Ischnura elegans]|uniref:putative RNA-binding protein Luc7-like 1 isoform X1 n=1 Tax=Ischnura elegans TaxID=197161 RepID=UPI001ED8B7E9|nr:putative RNA-binding protein Luc7-like 1 isoform X1 [Ischnura elegans]